MNTSTEEILEKLPDKIAEIYDLELAEEFTEIFEVFCSASKTHLRGTGVL